MRNRLLIGALSVIGIALTLTGCTTPSGLDSISITPATQSLAIAQTAQLGVTGTYGNASHLSTQPVTSGVIWSSNAPSVATVDATGKVTGVGNGTATITATAQAFNGPTTATATITVGSGSTGGTGGGTGGTLATIAIIPSSQSVSGVGQTTQFIAIGTTSTGATQLLVGGAVQWASSNQQVATIDPVTGIATSKGSGTTTITALYNNPPVVVTGIATLTVTAGAAQQYTSLTITPSSESVSASGQKAQLLALGTSGSSGEAFDVTTSATWTSSIPTIAAVGVNTGIVQGVSAGTTTITATFKNADNSVATASATITVTSTTAPEPLLSLSLVPNTISVGNLQGTGQFLAIANFSTAPYVRDVTNDPNTTWLSSFPNDFPVGTNSGGNSGASAGLVTAYASGSATIIAEYTNPTDQTIQTATGQFNCPLALPNPNGNPPTAGSCYSGAPGPLLATITVYAQGLNTTNWLITAPSATGTPNVIHCGPGWAADGGTGGSVCTATYPLNSTVTLTAPVQAGVAFGGWSSSCNTQNPNPPVEVGQNTCTLTLTPPGGTAGTYNATVSAVFNNR